MKSVFTTKLSLQWLGHGMAITLEQPKRTQCEQPDSLS